MVTLSPNIRWTYVFGIAPRASGLARSCSLVEGDATRTATKVAPLGEHLKTSQSGSLQNQPVEGADGCSVTV
jgi:hypothetical protein